MKKTIILLAAFAGLTAHAQSSWTIIGNAGTNESTNFIGTTDSQSLAFRTSNNERMRINTNGRFIFHNHDAPGANWDYSLLFGGGYNNTGTGNTVFGMSALTMNMKGVNNTAIGGNALSLMERGDHNVAVGLNAMWKTRDGSLNVALGMNALESLVRGSGNVGLGHATMAFNDLIGNNNVAIGENTFTYINKGDANVVIGAFSLSGLISGSNNVNIGANNGANISSGSDNIFVGSNLTSLTQNPERRLNIGNWIVGNNGTIGIGQFSQELPADGIAQDGEKYKLFVKDGIKTEKVKVDIAASNGWADYVFEKDYKLMPLKEVEQFINKNGHLPEVPTTQEAISNGIELKEMNILLLKKIEELTLYTIEQQKRIEALEKKNDISK